MPVTHLGGTDASCGTDRTGGALLFPQDETPPTTLTWRTDRSSEKVKADSRVKRKQREKKRGRR